MKIVILVALILVVVAGYLLWPRSVVQEAHGKTQAGVEYRAISTSSPTAIFSIGKSDYRLQKLELVLAGSTRNVPSSALENSASVDPTRPLRVFEEGPVLVVTTFVTGGGSIQWRFLNGQFAQRRILKVGQQDVRNFQSAPDRPSIIGPPPQGSARTLHSPSLWRHY